MLKIKILTKNLLEEFINNTVKQEHKFKGYEVGISFNFSGGKNAFYHVIPVTKEFYDSVQVNQEIELVPKVEAKVEIPVLLVEPEPQS